MTSVFELAQVYLPTGEIYQEPLHLGRLDGYAFEAGWNQPQRQVDF